MERQGLLETASLWNRATALGLIALGGSLLASSDRPSQAATDSTWQPPLTIENPFLAAAASAAAPAPVTPATPGDASQGPVELAAASPGSLAGGAVSGDAPAMYRLPLVGPKAPAAAASGPLRLSHPLNLATNPAGTTGPFGPAGSGEPSIASGSPPANTSIAVPAPPQPRALAAAANPQQPATRAVIAAPAHQESPPQNHVAGGHADAAPDLETYETPVDGFPYSPTAVELSSQLLPAVQHGYTLGQRGALFAAQTEFVQVMRRIALAKDAELGSDRHSRALAAGLRALDEAEDFVPAGIQLEADLDVRIVASSHRTPLVRQHPKSLLPHEAVALYHSYAQQRLAEALAGEQAGSMVLHGLGKVYVRLAERDDSLHSTRCAMTMFRAAMAACPGNHLAANELGVLLVRNGHPTEATTLFEQALDASPSATGYHNLAVAQQKLGLHGPAAANEQEAQRLASWERAQGAVSRRAGVAWVSPDEMAQVAQPAAARTAPMAQGGLPPASGPAQALPVGGGPAPKSPWQKTVELARSLPIPGATGSANAAGRDPHIGQPAAPAATKHYWR